MKILKTRTLRYITAGAFVALTVIGLAWHTGWGTLSSFGIWTIYEICPIGALESMIADRTILPRALLGLVGLIAVILVFGRIFCGWVCPVPPLRKLFGTDPKPPLDTAEEEKPKTAAEAKPSAADVPAAAPVAADKASAEEIPAKKPEASGPRGSAKSGKGPLIVLVGALASTAVFGFPVFCLICPVGLVFAAIIGLWHLFAFNEPGWTVLLFLVLLVLEVTVLRRWCHVFCPIGAVMTLLSRLNRFFRPTVDAGKCLHLSCGVDCQVCRKACPEGIDLTTRPGPDVLSRCTKCHECSDSCPAKAISFPAFEKSEAAKNRVPKRLNPPEIPLEERKTSFRETYGRYTLEEAIVQSSRCIRCGKCVEVCPQHNPIPKWMKLLSDGRAQDAATVMLRAGSIPEVCGRICPQDKLCESACSSAAAGGPVAIGNLVRYVSDTALEHGWKPHRSHRPRFGKKVAVIGAGPSGLACADILVRRGVEVTVYDSLPEAGGLLTFGIPPYKLDKSVIVRRRKIYEEEGIAFRLGCEVGKDVAFEEIAKENDAVYIATGAPVPVPLEVKGAGANGVVQALPYLRAINRRLAGIEASSSEPFVDMAGKAVAVLGGGDTAMDCARTAVRQGASSVTCIVRRDEAGLRASRKEYREALEEGVRFLFMRSVTRVNVGADGRVGSLELAAPDGSLETFRCGAVIVAFGFRTCAEPWLASAGVSAKPDGRIETVGTKTAAAVIYAGGDAVRGANLAVNAIADGREAGEAISDMLGAPKAADRRKLRLRD